ncbi:MAG: hypothetical protein AAF485_20600, partial [Chloroflexota bacterium]
MTGVFLLDWAVMAVSLANVILLLWLGLTVLLNADQRRLGVWLASGGLLLGAGFFISHSAILGFGFNFVAAGLEVWWRVGWVPVVALPFAWYIMMLWYTGFWSDPEYPLHKTQRFGIIISLTLLVGFASLLIFFSPLPSFSQAAQLRFAATPAIIDLPLLLVTYPLYIILCVGLALNTLRTYPLSSERLMGHQARQRARPWLIGTSLILLIVSLIVAGLIIWVLITARQDIPFSRYMTMGIAIAWFDLVISSLIVVAIVLVGQAIVAHEVFTGKVLPRQELQRQWRNAIILAVGYGIVVGWSLTAHLLPIYSLLLTTLLMTVFYALLSWRSYAWRERYIRQLRPFVVSQHLYEHLLTTPSKKVPQLDTSTPFDALCRDLLEVQFAYLLPLGALAPLVPPLVYPKTKIEKVTTTVLTDIILTFDSPQIMCIPVDPEATYGAEWAIPLWSERGLIGVLLLGPKRNNALYAQEEIEIARATGERLVDTQASTEITRRLMGLQRQRLAESEILDRRTRQVLHDDILPQLHTALLTLSAEETTTHSSNEVITLLTETHRQISNLLREIPTATSVTLARLGLIQALKKITQNELSDQFEAVVWVIEPVAAEEIKTVSPLTSEVLFYAMREIIRPAFPQAMSPSRENMLEAFKDV